MDLAFTGFSAGTELTFLKATNPYLHARWDEADGVFVPGEPSARFPVPFLGYMEVGRVIDARAPGFAAGDFVATTFGHKSGHTAQPVARPDADAAAGARPDPRAFSWRRWGRSAPTASSTPTPRPSARRCRGSGPGSRAGPWWSGAAARSGSSPRSSPGGAGAEVLIAEPSAWRRGIAGSLGLRGAAGGGGLAARQGLLARRRRARRGVRVPDPRAVGEPAAGAAGAAAAGHGDRSRLLPGRHGRDAARRGVPPQRARDPLRADQPHAAAARRRLGSPPAGAGDAGAARGGGGRRSGGT